MTTATPPGPRPTGPDPVGRTRLRLLARCRRGVTSLEYGLMVSLVGAAMIVGATSLGGKLGKAYNSFATGVVAY